MEFFAFIELRVNAPTKRLALQIAKDERDVPLDL